MASLPLKFHPPQAFMSTYAPRIRSCNNPLLVPVPSAPSLNRSKRNTTVVNYAEDGFDDSDFEDSDGYRRSTRTSRRSDHTPAVERTQLETGIEATEPVEFQGIWREWVGRAKRQLCVSRYHDVFFHFLVFVSLLFSCADHINLTQNRTTSSSPVGSATASNTNPNRC